jgi:formate-dependent nitrite reductase membrane component NrfD
VPDTFFTEPAHWEWWVILYFFIGGIAGGSFFLAALLHLFGRPVDRPIVRLGYYVAFIGSIISGILLIVDLGVPLRFWHMLFGSETGQPMFKYWSPISVGAWGLLIFGLFSFLAAVSAAAEEDRVKFGAARALARGPVSIIIAILGALSGFFLAGYTGVLLSVTNRPVWADSTWLGVLFLLSAASTAAAALIVLSAWRRVAHPDSIAYLSTFDKIVLALELLVLIIFLISLGAAARVFLSWWGFLLVVGVLLAGILLPLAIGFGKVTRVRNASLTAAALVLFGGFMLRVVTILSSEQVHVAGGQVLRP